MKKIALFCLIGVLLGRYVRAQEFPRASVYGGYSYLNIDTNNLTSRQSANGWEVAVSGSFNKWLAAEFDVTGHYKTYSANVGSGVVSVKVTDYSYLAGPRINLRPLFVHALVGGDHLTGSSGGVSESQDGLAGAFGGGVEWPVSSHWAVRSSVDYAFTRHNIFGGPSFTQNNLHVGVGLVYVFGLGKANNNIRVRESRAHSGTPISELGLVATGVDSVGAEITEVVPGSIAAQAGLRVGDVINAVDGHPIKSPTELQAELSTRGNGAAVRIGYLARGYWQSETHVILH